MPDVQGFLTKKAGPLPVWGWAAIGGGAVALLYMRGKGQQSPAAATPGATTDSSGQGPYAPSPIVVTPASMGTQISSANPATSTTQYVTIKGTAGGTGLYATPARSQLIMYLPDGTTLPSAGSPVQGESVTAPPHGTSTYWQPVTYAGLTAYVWAPDAPVGGGGGGGSAVLKTLPGAGRVGRFSSRHAHPQFLNVGMGGGGRAGLRAISKRTGLPEERLMALNPGHWRPTPGGQPRHIHIR